MVTTAVSYGIAVTLLKCCFNMFTQLSANSYVLIAQMDKNERQKKMNLKDV